MRQAEQGALRVLVHPVVPAEVLYGATSPHGLGLSRARAVADLRALLRVPGVDVPEEARVLDALRRFETATLDWADGLLLRCLPDRRVYTFDRQMIRQGAQSPELGHETFGGHKPAGEP